MKYTIWWYIKPPINAKVIIPPTKVRKIGVTIFSCRGEGGGVRTGGLGVKGRGRGLGGGVVDGEDVDKQLDHHPEIAW